MREKILLETCRYPCNLISTYSFPAALHSDSVLSVISRKLWNSVHESPHFSGVSASGFSTHSPIRRKINNHQDGVASGKFPCKKTIFLIAEELE